MDTPDGGTAAGRSCKRARPAANDARLWLLQHMAEAAAGLLQHGLPKVRSPASAATESGGDRQDGGNPRLVSLAEADRLEDRVAAGEWTTLERHLLGCRFGTSRSARALALRPLSHRLAAERQACTYPHGSTGADRSLPE